METSSKEECVCRRGSSHTFFSDSARFNGPALNSLANTLTLQRLAFSKYTGFVIDTDQSLAAFLPVLRGATWVALDTEADSLHAYPEKVCLIQISTSADDELIDPLARLNLHPLLDALSGHELIMHGADYDLR